MSKAPYRPDLQGRQQAAFKDANPQAYARVGSDIRGIEQIGLIQNRTSAVKEHARAHLKKYHESWVAKEAVNLWKQRAGLTDKHPAPSNVPSSFIVETIMGQARRNVMARSTRRLTTINEIKARMQNAVVRNRQQLTQKPDRVPDPELKPRHAIKPTFTRKVRHD